MKFETKYFGTVEVPRDEVITFPNGLFGFEEERSFLPVQESTLNFKCPVVVNPDSRRAIQVILESDAYHMRHRLAEFQGGKAGTLC